MVKETTPKKTFEPKFPNFWLRAGAFLIDVLICVAIVLVISFVIIALLGYWVFDGTFEVALDVAATILGIEVFFHLLCRI